MRFNTYSLLSLIGLFFGLNSLLAQNCTANFTFDDTGLTIQFTDQSTSSPGDPIVSWSWDFDDGTTSTAQNPLHTFPAADKYDVVLIITTQSGCTAEVEIRIEICDLSVSYSLSSNCNSDNTVDLTITINDLFDNADEIDVSLDGQLLPGSPYEIDQANPVIISTTVQGDGLPHTINVQSLDIGTCSENITFTPQDCSSNCFLSSLAINIAGGTTQNVDVGDNFFDPVNTTIVIGDVVHFVWVGTSDHSTTSDATSGPDSWNSGEIGFGSTYDVTIQNPGTHPYYCIPHGGPGGTGMSGTIIANCPAGNTFTVDITFSTTVADPQGFNLYIDGILQSGSPFSYNGTGPQSVSATLVGDGLPHTIEIEDVADPTCILSTTWDAPNCGAAPPCSISLTATESGGCNPNNEVPVEVTVTDINGGASGFDLFVDGSIVPGGPFNYDASGNTVVTVNVPGDGSSHMIEAQDVDDTTCSGSTSITTTNCLIPCQLTNLTASTGSSVTHTVLVDDFVFNPLSITITAGDVVEWDWVGAVAHTSTSDATSGPDSWDSGLLSQGATYTSPVLSTGVHPYYCVPHGAPGGVGMAGTITVQPPCNDGMVALNLSFQSQNGSSGGFNVYVDDVLTNDSPFAYAVNGTNDISLSLPGDGLLHNIEIVDTEDLSCSIASSVTLPDCGGNQDTCSLEVAAIQVGDCDANNEVDIALTINGSNTGVNGYIIRIDGNLLSGGPFPYDGSGITEDTITIAGIGVNRTIEITDVDSTGCVADTEIFTPLCGPPCEVLNLAVNSDGPTKHIVEVKDFEFIPKDLSISLGDTVEFQWTGVIPHTTTSDVVSGPSSWDSGLLGQGASYSLILEETGVHPYYCTPHGGPGGIGMAGTITVNDPCIDGSIEATLQFNALNFGDEYEVRLDGELISGSPFTYDGSGQNTLMLLIPGDGSSHELIIQDINFTECADTVDFISPVCEDICQLDLSIEEIADCISGFDSTDVTLAIFGSNLGDQGFQLFVDDQLYNATPFNYSGDTTIITITLFGDGLSHVIKVQDIMDMQCIAETDLIVPMCDEDCSIELIAQQTGGCNSEEEVPYQITLLTNNPGDAGFNLFIDGLLSAGSPFNYTSTDTTQIDLFLPGDGQMHEIIVEDLTDPVCNSEVSVLVPDCQAVCSLESLEIAIDLPLIHEIEVLDFDFDPKEIVVNTGDINRFVWTGVVPHTTTSDATSGVDSWNSGLLGQGAVYDVILETPGEHPYYCIPHGAPGGIGMAGTIIAEESCDDGILNVGFTFTANNQGFNGYIVEIDGVELPGSPFAYGPSSLQSFMAMVEGDGATHSLLIFDADQPDCQIDTSFQMPDCDDICFGFEAAFGFVIDAQNQAVQFNDSTSQDPDLWQWDFGDGTISTEQNPQHIYDEEGSYTVCLIAENSSTGCSDTICQWIDLSHPCLLFNPGFTYQALSGDLSFQFFDQTTGTPNIWLWGFGDGNTSNEQHPVHQYDQPGNYNVCLLVQDTLNNCNRSFCMEISVNTTNINSLEIYNRSIKIYPNPSSGFRQQWSVEGIDPGDFGKDLKVKLYDVKGRNILQNKAIGSRVMQITYPDRLSRGIYTLELRSESAVYRGKLIIQ